MADNLKVTLTLPVHLPILGEKVIHLGTTWTGTRMGTVPSLPADEPYYLPAYKPVVGGTALIKSLCRGMSKHSPRDVRFYRAGDFEYAAVANAYVVGVDSIQTRWGRAGVRFSWSKFHPFCKSCQRWYRNGPIPWETILRVEHIHLTLRTARMLLHRKYRTAFDQANTLYHRALEDRHYRRLGMGIEDLLWQAAEEEAHRVAHGLLGLQTRAKLASHPDAPLFLAWMNGETDG